MTTKISSQEYRHRWAALFAVILVALALSAIGGKVGDWGVWLVALLLAVFILTQGVSFGKTSSFKSFEVTP